MLDNYEHSTHQPLINWVLSSFLPALVVEVGIGDFSSPIFWKYNIPTLIHIENDQAWIDRMKAINPEAHFILHEISPRVNDQSIKWSALTKEEQSNIVTFYNAFNFTQYETPRLLFVDGYACCRMRAIMTWKSDFDFIIYHDAEEVGSLANDYGFELGFSEFRHFVLKSPRTWTGILIRKNIPIQWINLWTWVERYEKEHNIKMNIVERHT